MGNSNPLQNRIMRIIDDWVRAKKEPVPQRHIVSSLSEEKIPQSTIKAAVRTLVSKGYLRKAVSLSNSASYVQLRSL